MASPDYAALVDAVVASLRGAAVLEGVHVTDDPSPLTDMQCPGVQVMLSGFSLTPQRIGPPNVSSPYDETITLSLRCIAYSAESAGDAARQRDALVRSVRDALAADYTLGGRVLIAIVTSGSALTGTEAGVFSGMELTLACSVES